MKSALGADNEALIELTLMEDEGRFQSITAMIDTGWNGELYLGHKLIQEMRLRPHRFQKTWIEQNPEPLADLLGAQQLPVWQGQVAMKEDQGKTVKVHQGLRGNSERARVGRAFLKRFGILLILDIEGKDYQVLSRSED